MSSSHWIGWALVPVGFLIGWGVGYHDAARVWMRRVQNLQAVIRGRDGKVA